MWIIQTKKNLALPQLTDHRRGQAGAGGLHPSQCSSTQFFRAGNGHLLPSQAQQCPRSWGEIRKSYFPAVPWCHNHLGMAKPIRRYQNLTWARASELILSKCQLGKSYLSFKIKKPTEVRHFVKLRGYKLAASSVYQKVEIMWLLLKMLA